MSKENKIEHTKDSFSIQETNYEHMNIITKQRIPKTDFASSSWEIMIKYRTNEQMAFFVVETLEFDVLYKTYDIYLDYYCSQKWSADLVSVIEINKNEN